MRQPVRIEAALLLGVTAWVFSGLPAASAEGPDLTSVLGGATEAVERVISAPEGSTETGKDPTATVEPAKSPEASKAPEPEPSIPSPASGVQQITQQVAEVGAVASGVTSETLSSTSTPAVDASAAKPNGESQSTPPDSGQPSTTAGDEGLQDALPLEVIEEVVDLPAVSVAVAADAPAPGSDQASLLEAPVPGTLEMLTPSDPPTSRADADPTLISSLLSTQVTVQTGETALLTTALDIAESEPGPSASPAADINLDAINLGESVEPLTASLATAIELDPLDIGESLASLTASLATSIELDSLPATTALDELTQPLVETVEPLTDLLSISKDLLPVALEPAGLEVGIVAQPLATSDSPAALNSVAGQLLPSLSLSPEETVPAADGPGASAGPQSSEHSAYVPVTTLNAQPAAAVDLVDSSEATGGAPSSGPAQMTDEVSPAAALSQYLVTVDSPAEAHSDTPAPDAASASRTAEWLADRELGAQLASPSLHGAIEVLHLSVDDLPSTHVRASATVPPALPKVVIPQLPEDLPGSTFAPPKPSPPPETTPWLAALDGGNTISIGGSGLAAVLAGIVAILAVWQACVTIEAVLLRPPSPLIAHFHPPD